MAASQPSHGLYARRIVSAIAVAVGGYIGYRVAISLRLVETYQVLLLVLAIGVMFVLGVRFVLLRTDASDFVDTTEDEFRRLTWPTTAYLKRATVVVIAVMAGFSGILFVYDLAWQKLFTLVGFLQISS